MSNTTGPGRPVVATWNARITSSGSRSIISTLINSFTAGLRISTCLLSCVMFFQECSRWLFPTIATRGVPAFSASTNPVTKLVAPGPSVASKGGKRLHKPVTDDRPDASKARKLLPPVSDRPPGKESDI